MRLASEVHGLRTLTFTVRKPKLFKLRPQPTASSSSPISQFMPSHPTDALWDRDEPSLPIQAQMHVCEQNRWLLSLYAIKWFVSYAATPKEASGGGVRGDRELG